MPAVAQDPTEPTQALHDDFSQRLNQYRREAGEIAALPRTLQAADERAKRADELHDQLRRLVVDLRAEVAAANKRKIEADEKVAEAHAAADQEQHQKASELTRLEEGHRDRVFVLLKDAQTQRLAVKEWISPEKRSEDQSFLLADLRAEAELMIPLVEALGRHHWRTLSQLPTQWANLDFLGRVTAIVFWGLVTLILWWTIRRRVTQIVPSLLRWWADRTHHYVQRDLRGMGPSTERTLVALVDLMAIGVLLRLVRAPLPELGLLLLISLQWALYRMLLGLASLAIASYPEVRPCLVTLPVKARTLALRTLHYLVLWLLASQFLRYLALEILAAVTLHQVLGFVFHLVLLVVLGFWIFHRWEPLLREALVRRAPVHPLVHFQTGRQLGLLRSFQGLAHALLYGYFWLRDLIAHWGGWAVLPWRRKPPEDDLPEKAPALPGDVVKQLFRRECSDDEYTARPEARQELDACFERWRNEKRRGVAMVLGAEGMGKRIYLDQWLKSDPGHLRVRLGERLTTRDQARAWLASLFEIEDPPADTTALAGRIKAQCTHQVVIVEALQFAFLRRVNGFAALRDLLSIVAATRDQIFWVLSMHEPAWHYLASLDGLVHTGVCQKVIPLRPFKHDELRGIIDQRIRAANHQVDFRFLLPRGARHRTDPLALEQVKAEYFRRLAWASQGNPSVALRLWRETLIPGRAIPGRAIPGQSVGELRVLRYTESPALPTLHDTDLFLLAAIHTHRSLTENEIALVTNMNPARVSSSVRDLETRWLLTTRSKRFSIDPRYLPAITDLLRQRHFIHGSP